MKCRKMTHTKDTARLVVTWKCHRTCEYCVNKQSHIRKQIRFVTIDELRLFKTVCITGGEPLLDPTRTLGTIRALWKAHPEQTLYMYTTICPSAPMLEALKYLDGVHFTLHKDATWEDIAEFNKFQELIGEYGGSFRLALDPEIRRGINIIPARWKEIRIKYWRKPEECIVPEHEELVSLVVK